MSPYSLASFRPPLRHPAILSHLLKRVFLVCRFRFGAAGWEVCPRSGFDGSLRFLMAILAGPMLKQKEKMDFSQESPCNSLYELVILVCGLKA
jgi:hypothetical protein